ncbi:cytochrome P450 [Polychaeton citri CBS 116435]|uniref:Cytochrome P450 n=1 Tax=Polychaeton citri CBS 116435 TaxID=1314669 RepID=A0A9P4QDG0_9PEZI|nr:cytochrome P450 [Polychaeton citri CBS 116435]
MFFSPTLLLLFGAVLYAVTKIYNSTRRDKISTDAPALLHADEWPLVGSVAFFSERWDFIRKAAAKTKSGCFSFWARNYHVVALTGEEGRRVFMEARELEASEGYEILLGGQPQDATSTDSIGFEPFKKRLVKLLKGSVLKDNLPLLLSDLHGLFEEMAADPMKITQPFESIYGVVFKLTMRTVACNEVADSPELCTKILRCFETIEKTGDNAFAVLFPSVWTPNKARRTWAGAQIYMVFKKIADERARSGKREKDAMQLLLDQGDNVKQIIGFIIGALFAGQLNSGINASWMILYLSRYPEWQRRVRAEVEAVASRYAPNKQRPLKERLMEIPIDAWENEFPTIDVCLKDCIRLSMGGVGFRRNTSKVNVPIGNSTTEVIPPQAFAVYAAADTHMNPDIFPNPSQWDPDRYSAERAEDKKVQYGWWGWGQGRHPCLGMRFAKLENNMITAFWLAYFDSEIVDASGNPSDALPAININNNTAKKPEARSYVKYELR